MTTVLSKNELQSLLEDEERKKNITGLVIGDGNDDLLEICGFDNLEMIRIMEETKHKVKSLVIADNPWLTTIHIGDGACKDADSLKLESSLK